MQLSTIESGLLWLVLPVVAMALALAPDGSTPIGTGQLNLLNPQNLSSASVGRAAHCKPDPYDPYVYVSSLNYTFPSTPNISEAFANFADVDPDLDGKSFDCFIELLGGIIVFEIKGEIDSDGTLVFEVWVGVLFFNYKLGPYRCNILELDVNPCTFDIHVKYVDGQGGLYPEADADPKLWDLCLKVDVTYKIPYRKASHEYYNHCFWKFAKQNDTRSIS